MASDAPPEQSQNAGNRLKKELGLWDVYCISTGAMFSSGFFLLPGLATAHAGPSTVLAYLLAGLLIIPAMLCMAELSTALPRAGGTYYFLDRSLGPAVGTVGGLGTWLALVLKCSFALLGMGAYLAITPGLESLFDAENSAGIWLIKGIAVVLAIVFGVLNIFGAKESTRLQSVLVLVLLGVLGLFVVQGLWHVFADMEREQVRTQYTPFLHQTHGLAGLAGTIGLVFVSYAGLTKVASVSEEVRRPERNLPLGMFLSLATATGVYVLGVFIMIAVLDLNELREDYTPVATAADAFFDWLPGSIGLLLVIAAALAAFASTGNAGILAASRYPYAMARDKLVPARFGKIGRFGTPTAGVVITSVSMIFFIVVLSAEGVAKIGSAFNLLVFGLLNLAVVVMRESRIESYDPGFRVPLYPWTPLAGLLISGWLIFEMGALAIAFSVGIIIAAGLWYRYYAQPRTERAGALNHVFERLGRQRHDPLRDEFREIIKEKGLRDDDPFDEVVARADVIDADDRADYDQILEKVAERFAVRLPVNADDLAEGFRQCARHGGLPIARKAAIPHFRTPGTERSELVLVRSLAGVTVTHREDPAGPPDATDAEAVHALFFLVSPEDNPGQHLRILSHIASRIEEDSFAGLWRRAGDEQELKEVVLRDERFLVLHVGRRATSEPLVDRQLRDLELPPDTLVAMIRRSGRIIMPSGSTVLRKGDRLTVIGTPEGIAAIHEKYIADREDDAD